MAQKPAHEQQIAIKADEFEVDAEVRICADVEDAEELGDQIEQAIRDGMISVAMSL